jgi:predicted amidohydrolase
VEIYEEWKLKSDSNPVENVSELEGYQISGSGFRVTERFFSGNNSLPSIGIAQLHAIVPDIEANKDKIIRAVEVFKERKVNMAIFPEFALSGYFWEDEVECRKYMDQAVIENHMDWVNKTLMSYRDDTFRGCILNNIRKGSGSKYYNSTYIIGGDGDILNPDRMYDKIFLPGIERIYTETGGDDALVVDGPTGRFGFTTCYDICFSQLVLEYAKIDKVDAIIEMASWRGLAFRDYPGMNVGTDLYYAHLWDMLICAMAATNQVWIIACNAVGRHGISGAAFAGGSGLWAPSGMKLLQASRFNEELLIIHNVDIQGQRAIEKDDFNYALDFGEIYRPVEGKRAFTRF